MEIVQNSLRKDHRKAKVGVSVNTFFFDAIRFFRGVLSSCASRSIWNGTFVQLEFAAFLKIRRSDLSSLLLSTWMCVVVHTCKESELARTITLSWISKYTKSSSWRNMKRVLPTFLARFALTVCTHISLNPRKTTLDWISLSWTMWPGSRAFWSACSESSVMEKARHACWPLRWQAQGRRVSAPSRRAWVQLFLPPS